MSGEESADQGRSPATERVAIPSSRGLIPAVVHRPTGTEWDGGVFPGSAGVAPAFPPLGEIHAGRDQRGGKGKTAVVVCCHGLLSAKDSPKFVAMGDRLAEKGLWAVRFDFTGCGDNRSAFGPSLVETRLDDLRSVVDWVGSPGRPWGGGAALGLFGSSLGGYLSYVLSATSPGLVRRMALWSAPASLRRIGAGAAERPPDLDRLWPKGLPLGEPDGVEALPSVPNVLIVHGTDDELVPWDHAVGLYRHAAEEKRLLLLEGADHRLTIPEVRAKAMEFTASWLAHGLIA